MIIVPAVINNGEVAPQDFVRTADACALKEAMRSETLSIAAYDINDRKLWRRLFKLMNGYGQWLQLSVFQCRLDARRLAELKVGIAEIIRNGHDHVLIVEIGPADGVKPKVSSLGKAFTAVERKPIIV